MTVAGRVAVARPVTTVVVSTCAVAPACNCPPRVSAMFARPVSACHTEASPPSAVVIVKWPCTLASFRTGFRDTFTAVFLLNSIRHVAPRAVPPYDKLPPTKRRPLSVASPSVSVEKLREIETLAAIS